MPIPESQLETWSHQGSITQSSNTYNTIKNVLEASTTPYAGKNFKVFLQGSYGNDTNIYVMLPLLADAAWKIWLQYCPPNRCGRLLPGQVQLEGDRYVGPCDPHPAA